MGHVQTPLASGDIPGKNWVDPLAILRSWPFYLFYWSGSVRARTSIGCWLIRHVFAPRPTEFMTKAFLVPCVCRHGWLLDVMGRPKSCVATRERFRGKRKREEIQLNWRCVWQDKKWPYQFYHLRRRRMSWSRTMPHNETRDPPVWGSLWLKMADWGRTASA